MTILRGLTWGHRRAIEPLRASARAFARDTGIDVDWQVRSLGAFEHQPIEEAIRAFDLIVYDHPHLGSIVAQTLLHPLDEVLSNVPGALDPACYVGSALASYRLNDRLWAVPIDGATVHAIHRPDLLGRLGEAPPPDWDAAVALMRRAKRAGFTSLLAGRHHHPLLTLASLMANAGAPWPTARGEAFSLDRSALRDAIGRLDEALDAGDRAASLASDAIDVHNRLATDPTAAYCPAAYGYATYGEAGAWPHRLGFSAFPGPLGPHGTTIGGAGVGIGTSCRDLNAAQAYIRHLAAAETQHAIFATNAGQPARQEAWRDPAVDQSYGGYFSATASTLASAWVRPRFAGYSRLEQDLALLLQAHFAGAGTLDATVDAMAARADAVGIIA